MSLFTQKLVHGEDSYRKNHGPRPKIMFNTMDILTQTGMYVSQPPDSVIY